MSTSSRAVVALAVAGGLLVLASSASAQLRGGVSLDALRGGLAERGLAVHEIEVPEDASLPVRVAIGALSADGQRAQAASALIDVQVLESAAAARVAAASRAERSSTHGLVARDASTWADTASGAAGIVVRTRANVVVEVRTIDGSLDAVDLGALVAAAIDASSGGLARTIAPPELPRDLAVGASFAVQVPPDVIAARVVATGAGYARRTPRGWFVTRTAEGDLDVRIVAVDRMLRVTR